MVDNFGRWYPDYPGQQSFQDPAYVRFLSNQQARLQQMTQQPVQLPQQAQQQPQAVQPMSMPTQHPNAPQSPMSGGFVPVHTEQEARNWPIAPGSSMTFIDENAPYCYTKTMGLSQLDRPQFTKYRLVKEDDAPTQIQPQEPAQETQQVPKYALQSDFETVVSAVAHFKDELSGINSAIESIRADLYGDREEKKPEKKTIRKEAI